MRCAGGRGESEGGGEGEREEGRWGARGSAAALGAVCETGGGWAWATVLVWVGL